MAPAAKSTKPAASAPKKREFKPRPPRSAEERLPKLYHGLTDQVDGGHFQNAIKSCRKILALDPSSVPAFQTLLFLHLHTDEYASALALLDNPPTGSVSTLEFERAYCLYRLHREKEALEVLRTIGTQGRKEDHLEAQISYRMGDYKRAQELYDDLLAGCDSSSSEHPDIITNINATAAHVDFVSHGFHSHLSAPPPSQASAPASHIPSESELETFVPSLPAGWASGGAPSVAAKAPVKEAKPEQKKKPRHKLPKGAVVGKPFNEDPDRWLPMKQRASFIAAQSKKKGGNMSMGVGMTQGSSSHAASGGGGSGGGGGGNKKKKGKK
ncbi:uncharacterized protein MKK02DRAFT_36142 [Dioszegia hungarica]|uniref:Signal recognition particle subunit SRP72 n=1 Tax=Dioszegia hungarica TaxID=4972 RepID=A0AA38HGE9_9TREE|nr:uncharacterized protein MKK02DRAFT_36142 [Dioszegia hungarica]KAI9638379.1 hypothetical protein MKK02DRAFT_36142 [Dioszegia hungarica]